jgi:hypothetical protein
MFIRVSKFNKTTSSTLGEGGVILFLKMWYKLGVNIKRANPSYIHVSVWRYTTPI